MPGPFDFHAADPAHSRAQATLGDRTVDWSKPRVAAILRAAVECFARSGFDTTTAEIAGQIGIPKSVIYHYFDDKTTLVREAQRFAYTEHLRRVKEALTSIREKSAAGFVEVLSQIWKRPETRDIGFQVGIWSELRNDDRVRQQAIELKNEHQRMVSDGIAEALGIESGNPERTEPLSTLVMAALTGLSIHAYVEGDESAATEAHQLLMTLLGKGLEKFAKQPDSDIPPPSLESDFPPPYDAIVPPAFKNA